MGGIIHKPRLNSEEAFANLSVVIITLNEAENLTALLNSVPKRVELIVLDSGSHDETCQIATRFGAKVEFREFDNFSSQKNYAMSLASKRWTLFLDADEFPDETLWGSVGAAISNPLEINRVYTLKRRLIFLGKPMRFGRTQDSVTRLFPSHTVAYKNEIHETLVIPSDSTLRALDGVLWHKSYRDLDDYFSKFNRYTSIMASTRWQNRKPHPSTLFMAFRLPADFFIRYFLKLGIFDGWHGFLWASLSSFYSLVKYAKLKEISEKVSK
jgi:glycosyltransferase involved in cell wall biosynthesis